MKNNLTLGTIIATLVIYTLVMQAVQTEILDDFPVNSKMFNPTDNPSTTMLGILDAKSIHFNSNGNGEHDGAHEIPPPHPGCIIATATYGSKMAPEVAYMRYVRDNMIGSNEIGRQIVTNWNVFYYSWSPPIAQYIRDYEPLQLVFRIILTPLVGIIHITALIYSKSALISPTFVSVISFMFAAFSSILIFISLPLSTLVFIFKKRSSIRTVEDST
jgi:hypothetical protein